MEYQHGTLEGWKLRHYVLHRDDYQYQYCGSPDDLTLDHVIPLSEGGLSRVQNLTTACQPCNTAKGNRPIQDFLTDNPEQLDKIQLRLESMIPLTEAGHFNTVISRILERLQATGLPVITSDGVTTAWTRRQLGVAKSCANDAALLDRPHQVDNLDSSATVLKRQRRHRRQSIRCDKYGNPASRDYPDYCRRPRSQQGFTRPPGHSVGPRRLRSIRSGDLVRIHHRSGEQYTGHATVILKARRVVLPQPGNSRVTATAARTQLIAHTGRWLISN